MQALTAAIRRSSCRECYQCVPQQTSGHPSRGEVAVDPDEQPGGIGQVRGDGDALGEQACVGAALGTGQHRERAAPLDRDGAPVTGVQKAPERGGAHLRIGPGHGEAGVCPAGGGVL